MFIPAEIFLAGHKIPTMYVIALLSYLYWLFVVWYESRKDGFQSEKILDLAFISSIIGALLGYLYSKYYGWLTIFHPDSVVLNFDYELSLSAICLIGSLYPISYYSKKWKWSKFRLLDIYAMAYALFLFLFCLGRFTVYLDINYIIFSLIVIIFYLQILRFRGYKFPSGVMFSIFLAFLGICGIILFKRDGYLLIYSFLFTMSFVNLLARRKKSMYKRNLPIEFINNLKNRLLSKDKTLRESQQMLIKEDPYLQEGRSEGNSENMDEAILEDTAKEISDAELGIVTRLRVQVKKALTAIKLGKYGICETCGNPIDKARLEAYPQTTTCISCAEKSAKVANSK